MGFREINGGGSHPNVGLVKSSKISPLKNRVGGIMSPAVFVHPFFASVVFCFSAKTVVLAPVSSLVFLIFKFPNCFMMKATYISYKIMNGVVSYDFT